MFTIEEQKSGVKLYEILDAEGPDGKKVKIRKVIGNNKASVLLASLDTEVKNITETRERDDMAMKKITKIQKILKPFAKKEEKAMKAELKKREKESKKVEKK